MTTMLHTITGYNFHGGYHLRVQAPEAGGPLSQRQSKRITGALCGMSDCSCGGGYGSGADRNSATWSWEWRDGRDIMVLHPAH